MDLKAAHDILRKQASSEFAADVALERTREWNDRCVAQDLETKEELLLSSHQPGLQDRRSAISSPVSEAAPSAAKKSPLGIEALHEVDASEQTPSIPRCWASKSLLSQSDVDLVAYEIDGGDAYRIQEKERTLSPPHGATRQIACQKVDSRVVTVPRDASRECLSCFPIFAPSSSDLLLVNTSTWEVWLHSVDDRALTFGDLDNMFEDASARHRGLLAMDELATKTVLVVGLGSGGSTAALELAKAGVGRFILVDNDRLDPGNLCRHACGIQDVGRWKTKAVKDCILSRNPRAEVITYELDVFKARTILDELASGSSSPEAKTIDAVLAATDNNESRSMLCDFALKHKIVAIFGRLVSRCAAGDVQRVRPGSKRCLHCWFDNALNEKPSKSDGDDRADAAHALKYMGGNSDETLPPTPGLSSDIAPIVFMTVKLVLLELTRSSRIDSHPSSLDRDFADCDYWYWINRREAEFADVSLLGVDCSEFRIANLDQKRRNQMREYSPQHNQMNANVWLSAMRSFVSDLRERPNLLVLEEPVSLYGSFYRIDIGHAIGRFYLDVEFGALCMCEKERDDDINCKEQDDDEDVDSLECSVPADLIFAPDASKLRRFSLPILQCRQRRLKFWEPYAADTVVRTLASMTRGWQDRDGATICRWYGTLAPTDSGCPRCNPSAHPGHGYDLA